MKALGISGRRYAGVTNFHASWGLAYPVSSLCSAYLVQPCWLADDL